MAVSAPPALYAPTAVPVALRPLHAGLAGRDTACFRGVVVGDSVAEGEGVTTPGMRYMERFEKMLRSEFPTVGVRGQPGSSFIPAFYLSSTLVDPVQDISTQTSGQTATFVQDQAYGLGGRSIRLNYGGALRYDNVEMTSFRVHYAKGSFGTNFKVQVDGVDNATIGTVNTNNSSTLGGFVTATVSVPPGVHTIRVQTLDTGGFISTIHGLEVWYDDEVVGVKMYDASRSGAASTSFGPEHFKSITALGNVHAVFLPIVTNDAVLYNSTSPPATYAAAMAARMTEIDAAISNPHSIVVLFVPEPNSSFGSYNWQQYVDAAKSACIMNGRTNAYFLDLREYLGPKVAGDPFALWADSVHPNRKGHAMVADGLLRGLYLTGGGNLEPDTGLVQLPSDPAGLASPPANRINLYSKNLAGRNVLRVVDASGFDVSVQPHIGRNNVRVVAPAIGGTAATAMTVLGTAFVNSATTLSNPSPASGSLKSSTKRTQFATSATAGTVAYHIQSIADIWRGNAVRQGGFDFSMVFSLDGTLQTGQRGFFGLTSGVAAPTNVDPLASAALAKVGLAFNAATGNWFLVYNDGSAAMTTLDLGANFTVNLTDVLRLNLWSPPNGATIGWRVENLTTGLSTSGTLSTNLPGNTVMLGAKAWITNNATAAISTFNLHRWYAESDT